MSTLSILARKSVADCEAEVAIGGGPRRSLTEWYRTALGAVIAMGSVLLVFQLGQPRIFATLAAFAAFANIAEVVDPTNIGTHFAFVLVPAGAIFLRRSDPDRPRPFRVPAVPHTPLISIAACQYLMLQPPAVNSIRLGIWLAAGLVFYFRYGYRHAVLRTGKRPHIEPVRASGH